MSANQRYAPTRAELPYLSRAAENRERSESLVRGMEVLVRKFTALEVVPLDVLDRAERMLIQLHTSNLQRLPSYYDDELRRVESR